MAARVDEAVDGIAHGIVVAFTMLALTLYRRLRYAWQGGADVPAVRVNHGAITRGSQHTRANLTIA
jgi:hypothetical protein